MARRHEFPEVNTRASIFPSIAFAIALGGARRRAIIEKRFAGPRNIPRNSGIVDTRVSGFVSDGIERREIARPMTIVKRFNERPLWTKLASFPKCMTYLGSARRPNGAAFNERKRDSQTPREISPRRDPRAGARLKDRIVALLIFRVRAENPPSRS